MLRSYLMTVPLVHRCLHLKTGRSLFCLGPQSCVTCSLGLVLRALSEVSCPCCGSEVGYSPCTVHVC